MVLVRLNVANNGQSTLTGNITTTQTSFAIADATAFPNPPFRITVDAEILEVGIVNRVTNTFSAVLRGQEDTQPASHNSGAIVENRFTAGTFQDLSSAIDRARTYAGAAGSVTPTPTPSGGGGTAAPVLFVIKDEWTTQGTRTFTADMTRFAITNKGTADISMTINSINFIVKKGETFDEQFDPFRAVTISTASPFNARASATGATNPGGTAKYSFAAAANAQRQLSNPASSAVLANDGASPITMVVNGVTSTVEPGEVVERFFVPFQLISVNSNNVPYRCYVKGDYLSILNGAIPGSLDTTPPVNVTNLVTSNVTQSSVTLGWTASTSSDTASYDVYNGAVFLSSVSGTTYTATGLTANTAYTFTVKAKDFSGNVATGTSVSTTTAVQPADSTPPDNVTNLVASNIAATTLTLTWTASTAPDTANYNVYNGAVLIGNTVGTNFNATGLTAGTNYTFWVKARDTSNNEASGTSVAVTTSVTSANAFLLKVPGSTGSTVEWKGGFFTVKSAITLRGVGHFQTAAAAIAWEFWDTTGDESTTGTSAVTLTTKLANGTTAAVKDSDGYLMATLGTPVTLQPNHGYCLCFDSGTGYNYSQTNTDMTNDALINAAHNQWLKGNAAPAGPPVAGKALINQTTGGGSTPGQYAMKLQYS